ncbi:MAG TPA: LD-carboxypeptidase [Burkholderiaceae bacterium]|nr:LD-carboxypeptidase [Burkholderiaceae bacterium]
MPQRSRTVGFVAPSSYMPDAATVDRAAQFFASRGWRVQAGDTCFARHERFAGPDDLRASELQRFCTDPTIDVVVAARGGYGLSRILDRLDFEAMRRANRTIVGYSDFTAFNLAYLALAGGVSFQGPSAGDFGAVSPDPFTVENFFGAIDGAEHVLEFDSDGPACEVRGTLWGGNLALLTALVGTRYMPKVRGGILFIEDVNEPAYRIERMLYQLLHAGILEKQKAIVVGDFDPVTPMPNDNGFAVATALNQLRGLVEAPLVSGLPFGHIVSKATLPVGGSATLTVRGSRARLAFSRGSDA